MPEDGTLREGYGTRDVTRRDQGRATLGRQAENGFDNLGLTGFGRETNPGQCLHDVLGSKQLITYYSNS